MCLSSGLTPQYRVDVLTLLALPRGSYIQFRYDDGIVSDSLRKPLADNKLVKKAVLLAHVDCNRSAQRDRNCPITPCRHSILVSSLKLGQFYFLQFRLEEFATCSDLVAFQKSISGDRPHWISEKSEEKVAGLWCFESQSAHKACGKEKQLTGWQQVIASLSKSEDFSKEQFFFAVEGLYVRGETGPCEPKNGEFVIRSERNCLLQLFNFHPDADKHIMASTAGAIKVEVSQPHLEAVTSPTLPVGSPYDLKRFHFRTASTTAARFGSVVVRTVQNTGQPIASQPELFIPIKVKPAWFRTAALICLIAALLFAQQFLSAQSKGSVSSGVIAGLALLAIATAVVAVLGLKRPV